MRIEHIKNGSDQVIGGHVYGVGKVVSVCCAAKIREDHRIAAVFFGIETSGIDIFFH